MAGAAAAAGARWPPRHHRQRPVLGSGRHQLNGRVRLLAPDLRGRAGSRDEPGPYGLGRHADDVVALLDERGVDRAVVAGHSMGAYVAALAAVRHPDRVTSVVLVDGGLSFPLPPGTDVDALLTSVLGPAVARLEVTFAHPGRVPGLLAAHPAFGFDWTPELGRVPDARSHRRRPLPAPPASPRRSGSTARTCSPGRRPPQRSPGCRCPGCCSGPTAVCSTRARRLHRGEHRRPRRPVGTRAGHQPLLDPCRPGRARAWPSTSSPPASRNAG